MKCNALRWAWGLIPIAILCWIAVLSERERIETDLRSRAQAALSKSGFSWASSKFNGRDALLAGQATDEADPDHASRLLQGLWGVRLVDNRTELIEKVDIYNWIASERDNKVRLTGFVPNDATRKAIIGVARANFPKREIEDRMKAARGAPPRDTWMSGVSFSLKSLAQLSNGTVELEGTNLSIAGRADDAASYKSLKAALSSGLPQGIRLKADRVSAPLASPYLWSARHEANQLMLSGHVPSEQQRAQLATVARAAFPRAAIVDRMEVADGASDVWGVATATIVRELARLDEWFADLRANQLNVAGMAADDVVAEATRKALRERLPAPIRLTEAIKFKAVAVPTFSPFRTLVESSASVVTISGHAPSDAAKAAMTETVRARLPNRRVEDRLEVGHGAPSGWQSCMQLGLAGLGRLGTGKVALTNRHLVLTSETTDAALREALPGEIALAVGQACDLDVGIALREVPEPNLAWKATRTAGQLLLEGEVPDAAAKRELAEQAARLFPGLAIVDRARVADVPAQHWRQAAEAGLEQLARLRFGAAELKGQHLTLSGEAGERAVAATIHEQVTRRLAKGYTAREAIAVRTEADVAAEQETRSRQEVAALDARRRAEETAAAEARSKAEMARCQEALQRIVRSGTILFERASVEINRKSHATLKELAETLQSCPSVAVEIEGHTDSEGTPERNKRWSERRAESVREHLVKYGVDAARLVAIGYGQERPIAPNETAEERARNRRIEFTVKGK